MLYRVSNKIVATRVYRARMGLDSWVYRLSAPVRFERHGRGEETLFVNITSARIDGEVQTLIYPSNEHGDVVSYSKLPGSYAGGVDQDKAVTDAGWDLSKESVSRSALNASELRDCIGIHTHTPVNVPEAMRTVQAQETEVRDYVAVDSHGHKVWGPGRDYAEAKRHADQAGGVVQWIPSARAADQAAAEDVFSRSIRWNFDGHVYQGTGRRGDYLIVPMRGPQGGPSFIVYRVQIDSYGGINKEAIGKWPSHVKAMEFADKYDLGEIEFEPEPSTRRERTPPPPPVPPPPTPAEEHEARETVPVIYEAGAQESGKPWPSPETIEEQMYGAKEPAKPPTFAKVREMLLSGLKERGWAVAANLKVPHATSPDGSTRLWFKTQSIYINDPGTDPRQFSSTHSMSSDMREYASVDALLASVARWNQPREASEQRATAQQAVAPMQGDCLPWVRVTRDPERYEACLAKARKIGPIENSRKVYDLLSPALAKEDQEVLCVVLLDVRRQLRGVSEIHRGQRSRVSVGVTDVMRVVIAAGAEAFVVVHQHPSGHSKPSDADVSLTKSIDRACAPFGKDLTFLGHVVIGTKEFSEISPEGKTSKPYRV
jgi:RadC-like JAB domain